MKQLPTYQIESANQAMVFEDPTHADLLMALVPAPITMAALAKTYELPISKVHYLLSKWVHLGLVTVTSVTPRAGRAIKHYQAVAQCFHVPDKWRPDPGKAIRDRVERALTDAAVQSQSVVSYSVDDEGHVRVEHTRAVTPTAGSAREIALVVPLTDAAVDGLLRDIESLFHKHAESVKEEVGSERLMHVAIVPFSPSDGPDQPIRRKK